MLASHHKLSDHRANATRSSLRLNANNVSVSNNNSLQQQPTMQPVLPNMAQQPVAFARNPVAAAGAAALLNYTTKEGQTLYKEATTPSLTSLMANQWI